MLLRLSTSAPATEPIVAFTTSFSVDPSSPAVWYAAKALSMQVLAGVVVEEVRPACADRLIFAMAKKSSIISPWWQ